MERDVDAHLLKLVFLVEMFLNVLHVTLFFSGFGERMEVKGCEDA
jgi:hypothetical protein